MTTPKRRRDDDSPSAAMNVPGDICGHCRKRCMSKGKTSEAIQCDVCFQWVVCRPDRFFPFTLSRGSETIQWVRAACEAACEALSKDQYKVFNQLVTAFSNITYCCKLHGCLTRLNQLTAAMVTTELVNNRKLEDITKNRSILNQSINGLSSKIQNLQTSYGTLESNIKEITKSMQSI